MSKDPRALGPVARALVESEPPDLSSLTDETIADAMIEVAAAHAEDYLRRDGDELDLAVVRTMFAKAADVDRMLVSWLAAVPSPERLGVVSRALWQLWSTANPHPPIEDDVVQSFVAAGRATPLTWLERGPYVSALRLAAAQMNSPGLLALLDRALAETAE